MIWLEGVCAVPSACLRIASTMRIRVNAVIVISIAGSNVNTVITTKIWMPRAYSVSPFAIGDEVSSGMVCATASIGSRFPITAKSSSEASHDDGSALPIATFHTSEKLELVDANGSTTGSSKAWIFRTFPGPTPAKICSLPTCSSKTRSR